jgi:long-chain acyl-CoA synthetase
VSSHRNIIHALESWRLDSAAIAMAEGRVEPQEPFEEQRSLLLSVPLFHVSGSHVGMLGCLHNGRRLILMYKWDVAQAMEIIERERVSMFIAAPAITGDLVRAAEAEGRRLDSLLVIGGGGAPRAPDQVRAIARATPAAPTTGWGMTETNAIGAGVGGDGYLQRPDGVGWPSAVLDLRVVDADGRELPPGEAGELQVRGTAVFRGYWRRPEGERGRLSGRLVQHRRPGPLRRGRLRLHRRPAQGHRHPRRREHQLPVGRGGALRPPGGGRGGGVRRP